MREIENWMMRTLILVLVLWVLPMSGFAWAQNNSIREAITRANAIDITVWKMVVKQDTGRIVMEDVRFSQDGRWFAAIQREYNESFDGSVRVWDAQLWDENPAFLENPIQAMTITFSPDSMLLISGDSMGNVKLRDIQNRKPDITIRPTHLMSIPLH
jgi:WD40 repeat protein